ncbi:MAG: pyridoxamine 5'-phosphate oxidase family protein [Proteobacteria bacterium]|nr:pyridoxamine 5'-phosphate oxidase family protein [Pseudomonadota bacterium]
MSHQFAKIMFTDSVKAAQEQYGSRARLERFAEMSRPNIEFTEREVGFIAQRDTFYMATVNEDGWPYVQHRGGPTGFLRVIGPKCLAYADFRGNTQLVSVGNVASNDRVSLILMDYPNRRRLKILGHMRVETVQDVPNGDLAAVELPGYRVHVERVVYIDVAAFDWNCPQHITQRYTESEFVELHQSGLDNE